jgi:hypothetical protein
MLGEGKPNVKQIVDRRAAASDANDFGPAQGAIAGPAELPKLVGRAPAPMAMKHRLTA